jgi:uncharacterized protein YxjI
VALACARRGALSADFPVTITPVQYQMKQKLFALGDDFIIRDAAGNEAFFVDGKVFSKGAHLWKNSARP